MWEPDPPLVSIVTPCLNAARFIEEAVQSVMSQDYPQIEYIVMDGGSTDGTVEILERAGQRYEGRLRFVSGRDRGAADAINRGFSLSRGQIFTYLSADDVYLPGAVSAAVQALREHPEAAVVYGDAWWIDDAGNRIAPYPVRDFDRALLARECFICQPASFLRREAFENAGGMDPEWNLTFDYEFWIRLARTCELRRIEGTFALSRMHRSNLSLGQRQKVFRQMFGLLRRHYGYVPFPWIYAYLCHRADGRDQFFDPLRPSMYRYLESLPVGLFLNRSALIRYFREWFGIMSWAGLLRRIRGAA
jgi:glycosyltransferase involved in cell wall biosynthesis